MPNKNKDDLFDHIREGDLSEFRPQSENARIHPARAIGMLEKSINKVGWLGAVTVAADGEAFDGSLRLETIATALDGAKPIVVDVDGTRPVIVRRTDIPNADNPLAREASVWANRVAEVSEWDKTVLADWGSAGDIDLGELWTVDELAGWDVDLADIESLDPVEPLTDEDAVPEDVETRCKKGDIWQLGRHRLMCGDSTAITDVERLMDGKKADMAFTDPPYGVSYAEKNESLNTVGRGNCIQTPIENDHLKDDELKSFFSEAFLSLSLCMKPGCSFYVCAPQGGEQMMMMMMMSEAGMPMRHELIWVKNNHVLGRADYHYKHEPILYGWKEGAGHVWNGERNKFSVWEFDKPHSSRLHPTMKPVELIEFAIQNSSNHLDVVLDLFLGSGSTLIACEKTGRTCYGMELSEKYCDVILKRWEDYTGKTAVRVED